MSRIYLSNAKDLDTDDSGRVRTIDMPGSDDYLLVIKRLKGMDELDSFSMEVSQRFVAGTQITYKRTGLPEIRIERRNGERASYNMSTSSGSIGDLDQLSMILDIAGELMSELNAATIVEPGSDQR